ncbi:hypothetical protein LIER_06430 [Lithospermum erythrorhizon]|uniref:Uncharacterized protein n=1 Tax=Lithospermum erythrorhizon TaxID=34254 RepID=A0AAV3P8A7_LITER
MHISYDAKLDEVKECSLPGLRRGTDKVMQVHHHLSSLVLTDIEDEWRWGVGGEYVQRQLWEEIRFRRERVGWGNWLWSCYEQVWRIVMQRLKDYRGTQAWSWERNCVEQTMGGKSLKQRIKPVVFTTTIAKLWEERNNRCFGGSSKDPESVLQRVLSIVQGRASSWKWVNKSKENWF